MELKPEFDGSEDDWVIRWSKGFVRVMLFPLMVYMFFIPVTPYWADITVIVVCGVVFYVYQVICIDDDKKTKRS